MQIKTFKRRSRTGRKSIGVIAAPKAEEEKYLYLPRKAEKRVSVIEKEEEVRDRKIEVKEWSRFSELPLKRMEKIGESTFSEIYIDREKELVYKIVPLTLSKEYKKVVHTKLPYFIKESLIMERMNKSLFSVKIKKWCIISERYPDELIKASKRWGEKNREAAENIIPQWNNSSGMFGVIEMEYGGEELSKLNMVSLTKDNVFEIMNGICMCIKEMDNLGIEHRDLHESNILVSQDKEKNVYTVKAIDYTLSRMEWAGDGDDSVSIIQCTEDRIEYKVGKILYIDIDKELPWIFEEAYDGQPHRKVYAQMNRLQKGIDRWREKGNSNAYWKNYLLQWMSEQWAQSRKEQQPNNNRVN